MKSAQEAGSRHAGSPSSPTGHGLTSKRWWPWAKRMLTLVFFALVAYLLFTQARSIDWDEVFVTVRRRPVGEILLAAVAAAGSYLLYSCFDLLGRYVTGHALDARRVMTINFVSYAFNLNMGALVGGVAFRYRLYSRYGLDTGVITRVVVMSMMTNWLGYLLLAGLVFWWAPISLPPDWKLGTLGLRILGFSLFAIVIGYMILCATARRRTWVIRGHEVTLPSFKLALLQLVMSSANWLLIACTVFLLLQQKTDFPTVLAVMLVGAIAGVITHVPAGLGVLEVVFVALLSHQIPRSELLAALLTYRAIYYLAPLIIATLIYLVIEASRKRGGAAQG